MILIENMMEDCVLLEKHRTSDGAGGWIVNWEESAEFKAAIVINSTLEARVAMKEGTNDIFTITTSKNTVLDFHDVIKRKRDGGIFRVTSHGDDKKSPSVLSLNMCQVNAERWELSE